jgi:tetratricopeptide (TPR) repeat protein
MTLVTTRVLSTRMFSFENQRLSSISKQNMDADELSVLARHFWLDPNQENLEVAISDLRRALEINPAHANSTSTLAHLLGQYSWVGGEDPEAIRMEVCELASRALVLGRDDKQSVSSVGFALIDSCGEATVALQMTERAIKENPLNATMWATYGYSLIASGDIKSGFEALEKAEQLDRDYVWVRYLTDAFRATALMDRGDWQKGVNLAQKATSADPSLYWVQIPLANALGMLGDYEGARKQWQLVKSRFPLLSVERYHWYQRYTKRAVIADRQVEGLIRAEVESQD